MKLGLREVLRDLGEAFQALCVEDQIRRFVN
jgi:hypothetical protein